MQGRQLADIIATEVNHQNEHTVNTGIDSARPSFSSLSTSSAGSIAIAAPPPPRASGAKWALIAIPVAAVVAIAAVVVINRATNTSAGTPGAPSSNVEAAKPRASLFVDSDPPQAHIWINGESRSDLTPATIADLPIGSVDVKVALDGYGTKSDKVDLAAGTTAKRIFRLTKGLAKFQVNGTPKGASATLDGKAIGLPVFEASAGEEHTLVISDVGYQPKTLKVTGDVDQLRPCDGSLDKALTGGAFAVRPTTPGGSTPAATQPSGSGKIMVSASNGWCNAAVDGRPLGPTPTGAVDVSAGAHSITCTDSNGKAMSQGAKVNAGETSRVKFTIAG